MYYNLENPDIIFDKQFFFPYFSDSFIIFFKVKKKQTK